METAERLIAERGFDAVSVRDITNEADLNSASIHYHFGSKEGLVRSILTERSEEMRRLRQTHLDRLTATKSPTARDLAVAVVRPTFEFVESERRSSGRDGSAYVGFVAAMLDDANMMQLVEEHFDDHYRNYVEQLHRIQPGLSPRTLANRISFAMHLVITAVSEPARGMRAWISDHHPSAINEVESDLIDFLAGAFGGGKSGRVRG